ncbi:Metallo-hydrolase oxidoreductase [Coniophora puteana RWD-64-598 SS2]|uniref:Metallo-hydrolase oxidoreductase n=1 Tax=Coniophora puteana (strain RWD-64-598) TaxID=741705 RepID=A0A5M3MLQ2_CONPW|nr:Metallo-hydrolase oxidoreductase [Coniophora puteana RWD-64-598 SS2]EIW80162.1 Metallo-hydrolase oxidoreductase [Coniophora puteana RWD-64-598 SS2]
MPSSENHIALPPHVANQAYMDVSALDGGRLSCPAWTIIGDVPKTSNERFNIPLLGFHLRHSVSGKRVVYDLGMPRLEDLPKLPEFEAFAKGLLGNKSEGNLLKLISYEGHGCVEDSLRKGWVQPEEVDVVVISHLHWDHVGDARPFTKAEFVLGAEAKGIMTGEDPHTQSPVVVPTSAPTERTRFIVNWETSIGGLKAHDFFGDGSMYVLDIPGHLKGNVAILVRTSSDGSWILLIGDAVHHMSILHGERGFAHHDDGHGNIFCIHVDPDMARETIRKLKVLADAPRVQVQIAHEDVDKEVHLPGKFEPLA